VWSNIIRCAPSTLSYWQTQSVFSDTVIHEAPALGVSKCTIAYSRTTPAGTQEDLATMNLHLGVVAGPACVPLTAGQKADAETDINAFCVALGTVQSNQFRMVGYTWHDWQAGDVYYGPADRVTDPLFSPADVVSSRMPDQLAVNITMRTASRRHWGRVYVPGVAGTKYETTFGRPANSTCDTLASALRTLANSLIANTTATSLIVFSKQYQAALDIGRIDCDNVPDVIRRRRPKNASYRKTFTA
jgi:hypothetical protein